MPQMYVPQPHFVHPPPFKAQLVRAQGFPKVRRDYLRIPRTIGGQINSAISRRECSGSYMFVYNVLCVGVLYPEPPLKLSATSVYVRVEQSFLVLG